MNEANETLRAVRTQKAKITEAYYNARKKLVDKYTKDMIVLAEQEKEILSQLPDILEEVTQPVFKKYRKKPVIVEAYQTDTEMEIETLERTMKAKKGDWIIRGVKGELYPCKPDVFDLTYEKV